MNKEEFEDYLKLSSEITERLDNTATYESWLIIQEYVDRCQQKNQELKKQIEDLFSENSKLRKKLEKSMTFQDYEYTLNKKLQLENQQKEFIEWLEDKINFWKDKIFENAITENDWTLTLWRNKLGILEEILSKYKEIVGDK